MRYSALCLLAFTVPPAISVIAEEGLQPTDQVKLHLLRRNDVIRELAITDDQRRAMGRALLSREVRERLQVIRDQYPSPSNAAFDEVYRQRATALKTVLTPNQLQRLDELSWQFELRGNFGKTLRGAVSLDDEQQNLIAKRETELANELQQELQAFYRKSQRDLQELLTPEQRDKWKELVGVPFEFQSYWSGLTPLGVLR